MGQPVPPHLSGQADQVKMVLENLKLIGGRRVSYTDPKPHSPLSSMVAATLNIDAGKRWSAWQATVECWRDRNVKLFFMNRPISEQKLAEIIAILVRKD